MSLIEIATSALPLVVIVWELLLATGSVVADVTAT